MRSPDELLVLQEAMELPREKYLKWRSICERFDRGKHSVLAKIFLRVTGETVKDRESRAYADAEYTTYLEEWAKAEKHCVKARVEFENAQSKFEAYQSALSYDREHIRRFQA